jgi:peptide/nickel transport system permease protein
MNRYLKSKNLVAGIILLGFVLTVVLLGPLVHRVDPAKQFRGQRTVPPTWLTPEKESQSFILGTDPLGRDIAVRLMHGGRLSLFISVVGVCLSLIIGLTIGLLTGYFGGWIEIVLMRFADVQLSIPTLLLAITVVTALGPSVTNLILVLAVTRWVEWARVVRATVLQIKENEYVEAARAVGMPHYAIIIRHILPNSLTPVIIISSQMIGFFILMEAALSFLGLGVQPPDPSWGAMIANGRNYILVAPWIAIIPGIALMITVLAVNIMGDGLRDVLDPRLKL